MGSSWPFPSRTPCRSSVRSSRCSFTTRQCLARAARRALTLSTHGRFCTALEGSPVRLSEVHCATSWASPTLSCSSQDAAHPSQSCCRCTTLARRLPSKWPSPWGCRSTSSSSTGSPCSTPLLISSGPLEGCSSQSSALVCSVGCRSCPGEFRPMGQPRLCSIRVLGAQREYSAFCWECLLPTIGTARRHRLSRRPRSWEVRGRLREVPRGTLSSQNFALCHAEVLCGAVCGAVRSGVGVRTTGILQL
mmetsp:Transcript_9334/g.21821  ORF Transcript_9334/g.21821 Transcript_9334/m.21821 type:complete len:248 (-) Transcript_9334:187-930(-)